MSDRAGVRPQYTREAPEQLVRLARSVHRLMGQMLLVAEGDEAFDTDLEHAARSVDELAARLARHGRGPAVRLGIPGEPDGARPYYVRGALVGPHHPMFPDLEIETRDGVTRGTVTLDVVWEGPPGCVHGGYVAYLYDCILGHHNQMTGMPGMTGTLHVRYRRPMPLYRELRFEARTHKTSGRKVVTRGSVRDGERLLSEAEGLFVLPVDFLANLERK